MRFLADQTLERLRQAADWPDLTGTRYEAVEVLGQGGMGTVYRARDRELEREVALKVIHGPETDPAGAERLLREARVLARLEHPGLVPVHDAGLLPDGRAYYVMRMVRGICLDEHARALGRELGPRLRLFQRVCEAVTFAHAQGVVHRDLKPQNVMVGPFGEVLVMDWGVAKLLAPEAPVSPTGAVPAGRMAPAQTSAGTVLGTPGYMAPEQTSGAAAADERADVYALGAVLHFLLVDAPPAGPGGAAVRAQAAERGRSVPRPLAAIVARALAAEPDHRYAGVGALQADVERFLEAAPVSAYPEGLLARIARLAGKYRVAIALVLAYLVMRVLLLLLARR